MQECRTQNVEQMQMTVKNITIFYCADYQPMPLPSPVDQRHFLSIFASENTNNK